MKHAALYVRVSTQEQARHGLSIDNQIDALRKFCEENDIEEYNLYNDAGISGHTTYKKRPAMLQMIRDCQKGNIDIILFTRIDRFFRSIKDYYLVMDQIGGVPWRAIWEDYNTETSDGQFKVNIMLSISEAEASRTSEKIKSVLQYKRENGQYIGHVPYGYVRKEGKLYKDKETEEIVNEVFKTYLKTRSSRECHKILISHGKNISIAAVRNMLSNKAYTGLGFYEGYITDQQFDELQNIKKSYVRTPKKHTVYIFAGLIRCAECDHSFRSFHVEMRGKLYNEYSCRGSKEVTNSDHENNISISERKLEKYLLQNLESIINKKRITNTQTEDVDSRKTTEAEIKKLEGKLSRIKFLFEEGDIELDEYREKKKAINQKIESLKPEEHKAEDLPVLPSEWKEIYNDLNHEMRRNFWHSFIKCIYIGFNGVTDIVFLKL